MRFYDREKELALMEGLDDNRPSFVVITGRRRVGKTALIERFLEGRRSIYLFVDDKKGRDDLLAEFTVLARDQLGIPDYVRFESLSQLLRFLLDEAGDVVVAIDEFQRLSRADPPFITELQAAWDQRKEASKAYLLASGSSMGMMRGIFLESGAPLFKRADNVITLRPFSMGDAFDLMVGLGVKDPLERLDLYCLFGGMAYYYAMMGRYKATTLREALDRLLLSELAPLRNEVRDVMVEEFGREHPTYFEILSALAAGKCTKKEIGDVTQIEATSLSPYMSDLIDLLGLVEHVVPVTERPRASKKGRYRLKDNFFRFYFTFIYPNASLYEANAYGRLGKKIKTGWGTFRGRAFEAAAVETLRTPLLEKYPQVGPFWDRKGNELDLVGLDRTTGRMLVVEAKAKRMSKAEASEVLGGLVERSHIVPFKAKTVSCGIIALAVEGRAALESEGHHVWELADILSLGKGSTARTGTRR